MYSIFLILLTSFVFPLHSEESQGIWNCFPDEDPPVECTRVANFGDLRLCLPKIDGMTECYYFPLIREFADLVEADKTTTLGFYIRDVDYNAMKNGELNGMNGYFKIFGINSMKNTNVSNDGLDKLFQKMTGSFLDSSWKKIENELATQLNEYSFDQPVIVDRYANGPDIRSFAMLTKFRMDEIEKIMIVFSSLILIDNRIIWMAYNEEFIGQESIRQARGKNDYLALRLLSVNR